ncbi:MAG: LLM class F420-dependent oxidoreductase [Gammaproteobacteria bacterium]|nr:MAG: LLM class F420-dependent oxidoreductase [Gammaproteobacteria bacterium]
MKLGLHEGYWQKDPLPNFIGLAKEAESLGFDSVWTAEAYGSDALTPLAAIASHTSKIKVCTGVMQLSARTPVCAAMSALTLDHISNGRLCLGVGVSGPQVVEGWYGQPFNRPLERTREWIEIFRQVIAREHPVEFDGKQYQLPLKGGMGLGKPLKSITHPLRKHIPVFLGAEGPKNVQLAAEKFDGWLPIFVSPYRMDIFDESLAPAKDKKDFQICAMVNMYVNDNLADALLPVKYMLALYLGGMGAKSENFHKNLMERMGFGEEAQKIQDVFFEKGQHEAAMVVPDALADEISLCGPVDRIKERLQDWKKSSVTTMMIGVSAFGEDTTRSNMRILAEAVL